MQQRHTHVKCCHTVEQTTKPERMMKSTNCRLTQHGGIKRWLGLASRLHVLGPMCEGLATPNSLGLRLTAQSFIPEFKLFSKFGMQCIINIYLSKCPHILLAVWGSGKTDVLPVLTEILHKSFDKMFQNLAICIFCIYLHCVCMFPFTSKSHYLTSHIVCVFYSEGQPLSITSSICTCFLFL